jgi:hypothetical protein
MKSKAIEMLGETSLQLPAAVAAALAANDSVKESLSRLQEEPDHLDELRGEILLQTETMLRPVEAEDDFAARFARLREEIAALPNGAASVGVLTAADREKGDSLHLLVMDLHRAINALQASLAETSIDGASAYHLGPGDQPLIRAFMAGVNRTAPLKFDHPGLGTTATRDGDRLLIQNDIGATDAHILVIHVDADAVRLTYTDVHAERLQFLRSLFPAGIGTWSEPRMREGEIGAFYLTNAAFTAKEDSDRMRLLELIGSKLVFLIDWNKARKRLRLFLDNEKAVALLAWAAQENVGHRAFLQLGGEKLVFDAVEAASGGQVRYGETLSDMLGAERSFGFLKFLLKACARGLLEGRSEALIRDQIRAELISHFHSREQQMLELACDHGGYILQIADLVRRELAEWGAGGDRAAAASRAKVWERAADEKLMALRGRAHGKPETAQLCRILETADDAADDLEEAAYLISLLSGAAPKDAVPAALHDLAALLVEDAREWIKLLANAIRLYHHGDQQQSDDFLVAADALARIERETDHAERKVTAALVANPPAVADFHLVAAIAEALEQVADSLMRAGFQLHDHMLARVNR